MIRELRLRPRHERNRRLLALVRGVLHNRSAHDRPGGFFEGVSKSQDFNAIDNYSPRKRREKLYETIVDVKHLELTDKLRFQVDAVVEMETHLFPRWHQGGYHCSIEEICQWMADSIPRELYNLLQIPTHPRKFGVMPYVDFTRPPM